MRQKHPSLKLLTASLLALVAASASAQSTSPTYIYRQATPTLSVAPASGAQGSSGGAGLQAQVQLTAAAGTDFGSVTVGSSGTLAFSYANTGNAAAAGTYVSLVGADLTLSSNSCGTQANPVSVAAGQSCSFSVNYAPLALQTLTGASVTVTSNGTPASSSKTLSGAGASTGIGQYSGYRAWADGSLATSCNGYRNPTGLKGYTGATGDGVYRVQLAGGAQDLYCDMTNDGGGWTMVMKGVVGAPNASSWATTASLNTSALSSNALTGSAGKLQDSDINALKTTAYRLNGTYNSTTPVRYVASSCVYAHTSSPSAACATTYPSVGLTGRRVGSPSANSRGISDWNGGSMYLQTSDARAASTPDYSWMVGDGVSGTYNGGGAGYAGTGKTSFILWVK